MEPFIIDFFEKINTFPIWTVVLFVFVSTFIQQVFPPYPSDFLLLFMGVLAAAGVYPWYYLLITYFLGSVISSILLFELGYKYGDHILSWRIIKKLVTPKSLEKAKAFSKKAEGYAFLVSRFAPGMFTVMLLMGGIVKLKRKLSWIFIAVANIIGCLLYFSGGLIIGKNINELKTFSLVVCIVGLSLLIVPASVTYILSKIKPKNK